MRKCIERLKEIKESMERFENIEVVPGDAEAVKYALDILEAICPDFCGRKNQEKGKMVITSITARTRENWSRIRSYLALKGR